MASTEYNRVLIRFPNWVGDAVMATPILRCLRQNFPKARIDVTLLPYVRPIVEGAPWFDDIMELPPKWGRKGIGRSLGYVRHLRRNRYDLAVVLPNSFSSALLAFLSGAKRRVGYDRQGRGFLLTTPVPAPTQDGKFVPQPMVGYYLRLCIAIGAIPDSEKTELFVDSAAEKRAEELFEKYRIGQGSAVVAIAPGAAYGSSKLWVSENFAAVADTLVGEGRDVLLVGGPNEKRIAHEIAQAARSRLANLVEENMSLNLLKSIMKRCDLLITLDSGPRHFAVAFDKPVVVLMGPTSPRYTNCNLEKTILLRIENLDCVPCQLKKCPTNHECMTKITPDAVLSATADLLQKYACR